MNDGTDLITALAPVAGVLNQLGVRFFVGGSVASSFHDAARSTMDVDLVCELVAENVAAFVCAFGVLTPRRWIEPLWRLWEVSPR
ncbi:MAG: hypothetical protein ACKOEO_10730 [Planctomycetaceae bacterium]